MNKNLPKFILSIFLCFSVAFLGQLVTGPAITTWYVTLNKAPFNPPNWVFGPVWTILYLLMAISLGIVWNKKGKILFFIIQLILNFLWSFAFFYLHSPVGAVVVIFFLWLAILKTMLDFRKKSKLAANMLIPYLLWVSFASILNLFVAILN